MSNPIKPTVLVVEDDDFVRRVIVKTLRFEGFVPLEASSGACGVALAVEHHPDAVVMDLMMPGMDGLEAITKMRALGCHAPTVVLSANDEPETRAAVAASSAVAYLVKPAPLEHLVQAVRACMNLEHPQAD